MPWASINRPISGPTHDKPLPTGRHPLQLYSLGTPNGVKVTVMLEELLAPAWNFQGSTARAGSRSSSPLLGTLASGGLELAFVMEA